MSKLKVGDRVVFKLTADVFLELYAKHGVDIHTVYTIVEVYDTSADVYLVKLNFSNGRGSGHWSPAYFKEAPSLKAKKYK